jgi:hypothetical protein
MSLICNSNESRGRLNKHRWPKLSHEPREPESQAGRFGAGGDATVLLVEPDNIVLDEYLTSWLNPLIHSSSKSKKTCNYSCPQHSEGYAVPTRRPNERERATR